MTVKQARYESSCPTGDVDVFSYEVAINPRDEIVEAEVKVLHCPIRLRGKVIAQPLWIQPKLEIALSVDEGAARFRHLLAVDGKEAVDCKPRGRAVAGVLEHRRPEQSMEIENVFADEVVQFGLRIFVPELIEVEFTFGAQVFEARHVTDWCVEPDVEEFLAIGPGNREAEVGRVA